MGFVFVWASSLSAVASSKTLYCGRLAGSGTESALELTIERLNVFQDVYFKKHPFLYRGIGSSPDLDLRVLARTILGRRTELLSSHAHSVAMRKGQDADRVLEQEIIGELAELGQTAYLRKHSESSNGWNRSERLRRRTSGLWFSHDIGEAHAYGAGRMSDEFSREPVFALVIEVKSDPKKFLVPGPRTELPETEVFHPSHVDPQQINGMYIGFLPGDIGGYVEEHDWFYLRGPFGGSELSVQRVERIPFLGEGRVIRHETLGRFRRDETDRWKFHPEAGVSVSDVKRNYLDVLALKLTDEAHTGK